MSATAEKSDPKLWDKVKAEVTAGDKGGHAGQWSARKAQLAVAEYKKAGGGYEGEKAPDNHLQQWTDEDWGTKSGEPSGETGERYLPKGARDHLTEEEYARTTAKKRADTKEGPPVLRPAERRGAEDRPRPEDGPCRREPREQGGPLCRGQAARGARPLQDEQGGAAEGPRPRPLEADRFRPFDPLIPANAGTQIARRFGGQVRSARCPTRKPYDLGPGIRRDERVWGAKGRSAHSPARCKARRVHGTGQRDQPWVRTILGGL